MPAKPIWVALLLSAAFLVSPGCSGSSGDGVVRISGNIEMTEVNVAFKIPGKLVERNFNEGDRVEKGATVARLDQEQLLRQRDQARAALAAAESQLAQSRTSVELQRKTTESQIAAREAELRLAQAQLSELETGARPQEIQQAEARMAAARTELDRAAGDWERAQVLIRDDDISRAQFDQFRSRFETAQAGLHEAEEALALVREGPRKEAIARARAMVDAGSAGIGLAEAQRLEVTRREQEAVFRGAEIDRAKAQLALIEAQLTDTVAAAPAGGMVLSKAAEAGEVLAAGTTVLTIGDTAHPWLRGYIAEQDLGRVRLGQAVRVTTDSFPGKVYHGRIVFISSEAEFTPKQIQTEQERVKLVYRVKIEVDNPNQELKLNMPADAEIVTAP